MEWLNDYIVLVVLGICLCVGFVLKHLVPTDKVNRFIPLIMAVLGVLLNLWIVGWNITPEAILGGLASGLASTGMYELFKNFIDKKKSE